VLQVQLRQRYSAFDIFENFPITLPL
jgi:WD40 repeat protein